ncbi:aromatic ring-hydroxylating oxygenase subunit alpha [Solimonas terrae]|uniref:Aromatic ring-hydroxylating dioxygenase subunit alpha n=1 Tax=Solimonas terrae TaxID=1396819 RepID=A0A6M2BPD6_9GAMM|nr:aromatic ring-hydroxylating dioxygenase subunit alpha [Solimonas terrae]NGY04338.1 aromatic ring-hydroxylating dioxygenase subunit alpha [Solimonas terrae]
MNSNLDIEVDADVVSQLIEHLRRDTTDLAADDLFVPVSHFVDAQRARAEIALMKRLPLLVAHCSELPSPGDFVTREILGLPLIISRQSDGGVRAYLNMCRHRGGRVEQDAAGNKRVFMCRYHGWSYERDGGGLRHVPYETSFGSIEREQSRLIAFRCEERHGLVYVDLANDATRTLADWFGPQVDAQIAPWRLQDSRIVIDKSFTMDINWKLVMDGAIDIIHPRFLHQNGVGKLIETNVGVFREYGRHGKHFGARTKLRTMAKDGSALDGGSRYIGSNLVLYPNSMMIGAPEHVEFWTVWPALDRATRCTVQIRFLVRSDILDEQIEKRVHKSWEILEQAATQEDWPMERWIQQNAQAWPQGSFRYGRSELACAHLHRQLARDLDGAA